MMEESVRNEKIENYLLGRLNEDEMQSFRIQMDQDPELQDAVNNHRSLLGQIETLFDYQTSKIIKKVQHNARSKKSGRESILKSLTWIIIGAAVLLFLFFALNQFSKKSNEEIYATYYEPYNINFVQRGDASSKNIAEAGALYRDAEYANALPLLESTLSNNPKNTHIQMAVGICQLELNNYEAAIQTFKPLIINTDPIYFDQATWYSALAQLRLDQIDLCKDQLQLLDNSGSSSYSRKAQKLLEDLD